MSIPENDPGYPNMPAPSAWPEPSDFYYSSGDLSGEPTLEFPNAMIPRAASDPGKSSLDAFLEAYGPPDYLASLASKAPAQPAATEVPDIEPETAAGEEEPEEFESAAESLASFLGLPPDFVSGKHHSTDVEDSYF